MTPSHKFLLQYGLSEQEPEKNRLNKAKKTVAARF